MSVEFTFTPEETRYAMCEKCPTPHLVTYRWGHIGDNADGPKVLFISPKCQNAPTQGSPNA